MNSHGQWEITLVDKVLIRSTAGHFNLTGTLICHQELQDKAPKEGQWAFLENGVNWEMSSEESLHYIKEIRDWKFQNGCMYAAIITPNSISKTIYQRTTCAEPTEQVKYCDSLETAAQWLNSKGFSFSVENFPHTDFLNRTRLDV